MKYTLITGASSGIGFELAHVFAKNGHHLILVARSTDKLNQLKMAIETVYKATVVVMTADLSVANSAKKLYEQIQLQKLNVEILVNNAGFGDHGYFHELPLEKTQEMIQLNIATLTELTRLFLPSMVQEKSGKILNVASTAAFLPGPLMSVYYATKAYVLFFSEGLSEELLGTGVSVTALCPGPTLSGFQKASNVSEVSFFNSSLVPSAKSVAVYAYKALMNQTTVAIHSPVNKLIAASIRLIPRFLARKITMKLQEKR